MNLFIKLLFIICIIALVGIKSNAQDLLLTMRGDSLNVKVLSKGQSHVQFIYKEKFKTSTRELPLGQISIIVTGFYNSPTEKISVEFIEPDTLPVITFEEVTEIANLDTITIVTTFLPEFYIGVLGGTSSRLFGTRLGITQKELSYIKKIKSGQNFGAEGYYYFKRKWGVGIRNEYYFSNASNDSGDHDAVVIGLAAAGGVYRIPIISGKQQFQIGFWVGYQAYRNDRIRNDIAMKLHSKSMAWGLSASLFQPVGRKVLLSLTGSCFLGTSVRMTTDSGASKVTSFLKRENFEDLTRVSLTLGIGFRSKTN